MYTTNNNIRKKYLDTSFLVSNIYLNFVPGTKSLANEATFRGRGVYTNKMYRDSEPKPYREFILKRNGGRRRRRIRGDDSLNLERGIDLYVGPQSSRDRMEDSTFDAHLIKPEFPIDFLPQCRVSVIRGFIKKHCLPRDPIAPYIGCP